MKITMPEADKVRLAASIGAFQAKRAAATPTPAERERIVAAHRAFVAKLQPLSAERQRAVVTATANGLLNRDHDPYTVAVARQMQSAFEGNERLTQLQAELTELEQTNLDGYRPADPNFRGRTLARMEDVKQRIAAEMVTMRSIAEDPLTRAQEEAVAYWRDVDAQAERVQTISDVADRLSAEADTAAVRKQAVAVANQRRIAAGKDPIFEGEEE